jgi:hypothetical protein
VRFLVIAGLFAAGMWAQTRVDLKSQSKNPDFSAVIGARPFQIGTTLPTTCLVGGMFFKSDAAAGANLYGCVSADTWAVEAGGAGGSGGAGSTANLPLAVQKNGLTLTIGPACTVASPCQVRIGSVGYSILASATLTVNSGDGLTFIYIDKNGVLTAGTASSTTPSISCAGCQVVSPITQFPPDSLPLATWNSTNGVWDSVGTDSRAILSAGPSFAAGPNVNISQAGTLVTISAALTTLASGTLPVCGVSTQGTVWYTPGGTGVKDAVQVCAKDSSDAYAWRTIY